jgi:DNA-binding XRE family transcriptional regulator
MTLSQSLKSWRNRVTITQRDAASTLNVPLDTYVKWERGTRTPCGLVQDTILEKINTQLKE